MGSENKVLTLLTEIATNLEHLRLENNERLDQNEEKMDKCNVHCRARTSVLNDRLFEQECQVEFLSGELIDRGYLEDDDIILDYSGETEDIL